jgi:hypothetical protein
MASLRNYCLVLVMAATVCAQTAMKMTADQLFNFIKSSIQLHHDDQKVAEYVNKIQLSDKFEDRRVEELQGLGAGRKTVAALRKLAESSASLSVAPPPPPPAPRPVIPPPDSVEQARILNQIIETARNYAASLPNYMCMQVTRRHFDPAGGDNWRLIDTVQEQLSYVDKQESYKVVMYNGQARNDIQHYQLPNGGVTSSGEFGSLFTEIFAPQTDTDFNWDHWATLRGKRMYVFAYRVEQSHSHYTISTSENPRVITSGYHGLIYADRETSEVMRWTLECDDIPADYPVQKVGLDVNYDFITIADQQYVLPIKYSVRSVDQGRRGKQSSWNEADFHLYRKFSTESSITFDTPDAIPDDKLQEQPATPDTPPKPPSH